MRQLKATATRMLIAGGLLGGVGAPAIADPALGTLRICRAPLVLALRDEDSLPIHVGAEFVAEVAARIVWRVVTTANVSVPKTPGCVTVAAKVYGATATPPTRDVRLRANFDIAGYELVVTIADGFQ